MKTITALCLVAMCVISGFAEPPARGRLFVLEMEVTDGAGVVHVSRTYVWRR